MEKTLDDLKPILEKIFAKLGQGSEYGWELLVRNQVITGYVQLFATICSIALFIFCFKKSVSIFKCNDTKGDNYGSMPDAEFFKLLILVVVCLVTTIFVCFDTYYMIQNLLTPEYTALKNLLGLVK